MTYQVNDLGDGRFELVELRPIPLGILTSRRIAERFADFFDQLDEASLRQLEAFTADELLPEADLSVVELEE